MPGKLSYIPQNGNSRRAAKSAARQVPTAPLDADDIMRAASLPRQRNVEPVLSLSGTRYITIHSIHRTLAIPSIPFRLGQRVMDLYINALNQAKDVALHGKKDPQDRYFKTLSRLTRILWTHVRPLGRIRRIFWRLGLLRNPLKQCSEQELKEITDFFLQGRTKSSVQSISETEMQRRV